MSEELKPGWTCYNCGGKDSHYEGCPALKMEAATPPSPSTASEVGELPPLPDCFADEDYSNRLKAVCAASKNWKDDVRTTVELISATAGLKDFIRGKMRAYGQECARAALAAKTAQPSTGEVDVEAERKLFEACMKPGYLSRCTEPGYTDQYADSHTQMAWKAWLAARHTQAEGARDAARNAFKELVKKNTHRRPRIVGNDVEYRNEIDTYQIGRDVIDAAISATQKGRG